MYWKLLLYSFSSLKLAEMFILLQEIFNPYSGVNLHHHFICNLHKTISFCHSFFFTFQPQEMLQELTKYLRMTYYYCVWCGTSFAGTSYYFNVAYGNCLCSIMILKGLAYLLAISSNCPGNRIRNSYFSLPLGKN